MKTTNEAFFDAAGDALRVSRDERGVWLEIEERVGGEVVTTAAVGPLGARQARAAREVLSPTPWMTRLGVAAVLLPPAAHLGGLLPSLWATWGAIVLVWATLFVIADAG